MNKLDQRGIGRKSAGFIASGLLAFATDAGILTALTRGAGLDPFSARVLAIAGAMIVAFFAHRRWSFAVETPATWMEFAKFISVAASAAALNFAVYSAILLAFPVVEPVGALVVATAVAMTFTYLGLRFGVFRREP